MTNIVPSFETERLILRPVTLADAPSYQKHFADFEVIIQLSASVPWPYPEDGAAHYIRNFILPKQGADEWYWGIFEKSNPQEMIGGVDLWRQGRPENRGFWLGRKFWGQGYMTEAVRPVMDYAFNELGFETLRFSNALGNLKSRRIKEKTGARLIGTRRAEFVNPAYKEAETWELTREEWQKFRSS
jgi:RimJ/RimL family protein N-acetyltransferase